MSEKDKKISLADLGIITDDGELDFSGNPAVELLVAGIQMGRLSTQIEALKEQREQVMLGFMAEEEKARYAFGINFCAFWIRG